MKSTTLYYFLAIGIFLFAACGSTEKPPTDGEETQEETVNVASLLKGQWESVELKRNGNPVDTKTPFTINYSTNGTFTSNIFDASNGFPFEGGVTSSINDRSISFENLTDTFHIDEISDSSLILSTSIKNFPFEFIFKRK